MYFERREEKRGKREGIEGEREEKKELKTSKSTTQLFIVYINYLGNFPKMLELGNVSGNAHALLLLLRLPFLSLTLFSHISLLFFSRAFLSFLFLFFRCVFISLF